VFGETDREIFLQRFTEEARRPLADDDVGVIPSFLLAVGRPYLAIELKGQEVRPRELRIVGILSRPRGQRFVRETDVTDQPRIGRVRARADRIVVKRIVDAQIAHLHPAEVLVARCSHFEFLQYVELPFGKLRLLLFDGRVRRRFGGSGGWSRRRRCTRGCEAQRRCGGRKRHERAFQQWPSLIKKNVPLVPGERFSLLQGSLTAGNCCKRFGA
jgi:hypothetical protein